MPTSDSPASKRAARERKSALVRRLFGAGRRALRSAPPAVRVAAGAVAILVVWSAANWAYQAIRKPTEMFFPVSGALDKTPADTWREYGPLFREHSTAVMTPELLAALAQIEGAGNPLARTYWRWRWSWNPFDWYRPASSAAGMYQITDTTFDAARHYCIHDHAVARDGPWYDLRSCWFNAFYTRVVPSHAVEMTAAFLDRGVSATVAREGIAAATLQQKQDLAAVIQLCGAGAGDAYARGGFRRVGRERCGGQDVGAYLAIVDAMKRQFARLRAS